MKVIPPPHCVALCYIDGCVAFCLKRVEYADPQIIKALEDHYSAPNVFLTSMRDFTANEEKEVIQAHVLDEDQDLDIYIEIELCWSTVY